MKIKRNYRINNKQYLKNKNNKVCKKLHNKRIYKKRKNKKNLSRKKILLRTKINSKIQI